jgi:hypothetical protein
MNHSAQELERRRQSKAAKGLPVLQLTHSEFATIRQVGSNEEVADLAKDHERLKTERRLRQLVCLLSEAREQPSYVGQIYSRALANKVGRAKPVQQLGAQPKHQKKRKRKYAVTLQSSQRTQSRNPGGAIAVLR